MKKLSVVNDYVTLEGSPLHRKTLHLQIADVMHLNNFRGGRPPAFEQACVYISMSLIWQFHRPLHLAPMIYPAACFQLLVTRP